MDIRGASLPLPFLSIAVGKSYRKAAKISIRYENMLPQKKTPAAFF
jgi:hypothetical protein